VVEALLTFLYTWSYADFFVNGGGASAAALKTGDVVLAQALFNIKVYVAADKYGVVDLQQQAADAFGSALLRASSAAPSGARNGDSGSSLGRTSAKLTPAALTQIINEVYNGVATALPHDRVLRDIVCLVMSIEINALMREPSFVALFEDGGGSIAADAAKSLAQRVNPGQKKYRCPACGKHFEAEIPAREYLSFLCFHCRCSLSRDVWEDHVVLPDLAAVWRGRRGNAS
jgi:DNA-directed RNA polymerase subunit RPC12/RpoP